MKKLPQRRAAMASVITVRVDKEMAEALKASRINLSAAVRDYLGRVVKSLPRQSSQRIRAK